MFIAFFESIKYVGHLWPVALLRIYVGYYFLTSAIHKIEGQFLSTPALLNTLQGWLLAGHHNPQYVTFLERAVFTHWQLFSYLVVTAELLIGISFIFGFMVRPAALVAIFLNINFLLAAGAEGMPGVAVASQIFIAINVMLFFISAGRCFGFDYYFFKKIRGFWW